VKWVVSDYHYRELWYKVEGDIADEGLVVGFLTNFHTPIPFIKNADIQTITSILKQSGRNLVSLLLRGKIDVGENLISTEEETWTRIHPDHWIEKFGLTGIAASFCSKLKWSYWRYPWGTDNIQKYSSYPSVKPDEQPQKI
jgi:hypothetical protein